MVGLRPTRLWHHLCRKHFWWLIHERLYARCPLKKKLKKYYQIPDTCKKILCAPHDHFNKFDMLKIVGIVLVGTGGLCYAFGHFDPSKFEPYYPGKYDCTVEIAQLQEKNIRKIPCDEREPEPVPPCICDEPDEPPKKWKKKEKKPKCI